MPLDPTALETTYANACAALLAKRGSNGCWEGNLSSSALSTATALFALALHDRTTGTGDGHLPLVAGGQRWLAATQNADGGWGDTTGSPSNLSTTALCWAALAMPTPDVKTETVEAARAAEAFIARAAGGLNPGAVSSAVTASYGKDRTFSAPILTMLALAGRLGDGRAAWAHIPQLPFELAALPQKWFRWLRLPVVSYALPALIAVGRVRHARRPTWNPLARSMRALAGGRTLNVLAMIQPKGGGFLEATPLTSFVVMSLVGAGDADHPVVREGIGFLVRSVRPDGSWPIDTNLTTWCTTLATNTLLGEGGDRCLGEADRETVLAWLMRQQYRTEHPYTGAPPGGWAWTDLPGGVPDADDTAGALLALRRLGQGHPDVTAAAAAGARWLLGLQNADGGIPTFCRGWGTLPFDRSAPDLTAHALAAWSAWQPNLPPSEQATVERGCRRAVGYLEGTQRPNGAWAPLWFGNQHTAEVENLTYGTNRVLRLAWQDVRHLDSSGWRERFERAARWLVNAQHASGGWGNGGPSPPTIEETALAVEGLAGWLALGRPSAETERMAHAVERGINYLIVQTDGGRVFRPAPIGLYFAKLWYFEDLYPLLFTTTALGQVRRWCRGGGTSASATRDVV